MCRRTQGARGDGGATLCPAFDLCLHRLDGGDMTVNLQVGRLVSRLHSDLRVYLRIYLSR